MDAPSVAYAASQPSTGTAQPARFGELTGAQKAGLVNEFDAGREDKEGAGPTFGRLKQLTVYGYFTSKPVQEDVLKERMYQGKLNKARRGELIGRTPIGYVQLPSGIYVAVWDGDVRTGLAHLDAIPGSPMAETAKYAGGLTTNRLVLNLLRVREYEAVARYYDRIGQLNGPVERVGSRGRVVDAKVLLNRSA